MTHDIAYPKHAARTQLAIAAAAVLLGFSAHAADISLSGSDGTGYAAAAGVNNEGVEPNTDLPGSKVIDYPYYFDGNLWIVVAAEPLSAAETYPQSDAFNLLSNGVTDDDFSDFDLGTLSFDDSVVSPTGETIIPAADVTITINAPELDPITSPRNVNNEFAWNYQFTITNPTGAGLTFTDGVLTSIDLTADVFGQAFGFGTFPIQPGFSQDGALIFEGNSVRFDFDVIETQNAGPLGILQDARFIVTRGGTLDAVTLRVDTDGDGVDDSVDNCTLVSNNSQLDTDSDGYGNACDGDFNNDCTTSVVDLGVFRSLFFGANNQADLNGDGTTNFTDLGIFRSLFFTAPGPGADGICETN